MVADCHPRQAHLLTLLTLWIANALLPIPNLCDLTGLGVGLLTFLPIAARFGILAGGSGGRYESGTIDVSAGGGRTA